MVRVRVKEPIEEEKALETPNRKPKIRISPLRLVILTSVLITSVLSFYAYGLYLERSDLQKQLIELQNDPLIVARERDEQLLSQVGALTELPRDETPTIADVTDVKKARAQDRFYKDAENGDKVLFYTQAGKAILYRPGTNKIITIAPISQNSNR